MTSVLPKIKQLSQRVTRVLGCNPGVMTLQGTNTYLVGTGSKRLLIDSSALHARDYMNNLKEYLNTYNVSIEAVVLTHWHADHAGGIPSLYKHKLIDDCTPLYKYPLGVHEKPNISLMKYTFVEDHQVLNTEGATLNVLHTPGHSKDHIALHLIEENAIFTGDCVLGEGTAVFEDLHSYINSLQTLANKTPQKLYPGHGNVVTDPAARIKHYIDHRGEREKQIIDSLEYYYPYAIESMVIVKHIYTDIPVALHIPAEKNVCNHLEKLQNDGLVFEVNGKWSFRRKRDCESVKK